MKLDKEAYIKVAASMCFAECYSLNVPHVIFSGLFSFVLTYFRRQRRAMMILRRQDLSPCSWSERWQCSIQSGKSRRSVYKAGFVSLCWLCQDGRAV